MFRHVLFPACVTTLFFGMFILSACLSLSCLGMFYFPACLTTFFSGMFIIYFGLFACVMFLHVLFFNHLLLRHVSSFGLFTCVMFRHVLFFHHLLLRHVSSFGLFTCVMLLSSTAEICGKECTVSVMTMVLAAFGKMMKLCLCRNLKRMRSVSRYTVVAFIVGQPATYVFCTFPARYFSDLSSSSDRWL